MIPSLVVIATRGDDKRARKILSEVLALMKRGGLCLPLDELFGTADQEMQSQFGPMPRFFDVFKARRLVPTEPPASVVSEILTIIEPLQLVPDAKSLPDALSVKAGLFLINDFLAEAHATVQAADEAGKNTTAAYWHGILHRREPDHDNARYWLRRVGDHAIFAEVGSDVAPVLDHEEWKSILDFDRLLDSRGHWDAMAFIDLCQECGSDWSDRAKVAACLQEVEMRRLLEYTCRAAAGEI